MAKETKIPSGVSEQDIQDALAMLARKRERDKVRAAKIASGELVPKKHKSKPWNELSEEQRAKRLDYSKKWAARQRDLAKLAKEHGLDKEAA